MIKGDNPAGLILSAGYSSRMKDFKPLMKIGDSCPLGILIDNLKIAGIKDIYVVTGFQSDRIEEYLKGREVTVVYNDRFAEGMFTSVQEGVRAVKRAGHDCVLMTPVDVPLIPPYIFKALMRRFYDSDRSRFIVACSSGKKAHPLLIPAAFMEEVLQSKGENGMKSVTAPYEKEMIRVDTHCESILYDMDTQEAYKELLEFYRKHKYPNEEQCQRIIDREGTPSHIVKHCEAVTETALLIANELNENGLFLSIPLIRAAGSLHDVLRMKPDHAEAGAELMLDYGYPEVADIIKDHMKYQHPLPVYDITEKDIICLSDKFRQEDKLVTLEQRLAPVLLRFKDDLDAVQAIESKIGCTYAVMNYINITIGKSLYQFLREHDEKARKAAEVPLRRVFLIRHGETEKHEEKIFLGQTDVSLDEEGREQCRITGIELTHFDIQTSTLYCSDLRRAVQSAEMIIPGMGLELKIQKVPEFREMNLGSWDGKPIREIKELYPEQYEARGENMLSYRIDSEAENFYDLRERVISRFNQIVQEELGDIVIVAHSGVLRVLKCELTGRQLPDVLKLKINRGGYELFDLTKEYADRYELDIPVRNQEEGMG